jgi:antitoxin MazE
LAIRLPASVVEALDLKEGDEIEASATGKRRFRAARPRTKESAIALPAAFGAAFTSRL